MEGTTGSTSRSEGAAAVDADWRAQLEPAARQRIVNKILETLCRHIPVYGREGFDELCKIAVRFEEKIYAAATSQSDYLKKISLKLLSMESKSRQAPAGHTTVPNISHVYQIPICPDHGMEEMSGSTSRSEGIAAIDANGTDWRAQLQPAGRQRVVNKIMETLSRHLPISVPEGLNELSKIAVRFEEKIYAAATSQSDYLKKISLRMLSMESKSRQAPAGFAGMEGTTGSTSRSEGVAAVDVNGADWSAKFEPAARQRIVYRIVETLHRRLPVSVPEAFDELRKIAARLEEEIYTAATCQADYLKKILLKLLVMESDPQARADLAGELRNLTLETEIEDDEEH